MKISRDRRIPGSRGNALHETLFGAKLQVMGRGDCPAKALAAVAKLLADDTTPIRKPLEAPGEEPA